MNLIENGEMPVAMGIDFGTTNSVVAFAYQNGEVENLTWPIGRESTNSFRTALMFWRDIKGKLHHTAGPKAIAKAISAETDQRFIQSIKTHLASRLFSETRLYGERFTIEDLIAIFFNHLLDGEASQKAKKCIVVSGHPVVFAGERPDTELALQRLNTAYQQAGMNVELAYEPLGAAYWYARGVGKPGIVLVADFGGGTSDFSILKFVDRDHKLEAFPLAHSGVGVAGDTFDFRLVDHVVAPKLGKGSNYLSFKKLLPIPAYYHAAFAQWHELSWLKSSQTIRELRQLAAASEARDLLENLIAIIELDLGFELYLAIAKLKVELSVHNQAYFKFDREGIRIEGEVTRADFEAWIAADLFRMGQAIDLACSQANLQASSIDAVFLTGGTSFVPSVRSLFENRFSVDKLHYGDAFHSVASGLALLGLDKFRSLG